MSHQTEALSAPAMWARTEAEIPYVTDCHRVALDQLRKAYARCSPVTIMIDEGNFSARPVLSHFLSELDNSVEVVRIADRCADATDCMCALIDAIGFESADMSLADLQHVFSMYLSYQKTHGHRTIVYVAEAQEHGIWMLDEIHRLVQLEAERKMGLMVILSGGPGLNRLLNESRLHGMWIHAGPRIVLSPLTLAETRQYIRGRIGSVTESDIAQLFDFDAITRIHDLSAGVPDTVNVLCQKSLQLADEHRSMPVTANQVEAAGQQLLLPPVMLSSSLVAEVHDHHDDNLSCRRIVARTNGGAVLEQSLKRGGTLIGRDVVCDVLIANRKVSRHHALIVNSSNSVTLVDLGSTNGTFVHGRPIRRYTLHDGDVATIGDCSIEYVAGVELQNWFGNLDVTENLETLSEDTVPVVTVLEHELQSIE